MGYAASYKTSGLRFCASVRETGKNRAIQVNFATPRELVRYLRNCGNFIAEVSKIYTKGEDDRTGQ